MNKRCVIICAYNQYPIREAEVFGSIAPEDLVLCADGGYALARAEGIHPDLLIGDFDSGTAEADCPVIRLPVEKDDTDTLSCLKYGLDHGCNDFLILGGIGGRLDQTIANIQTLAYALDHGASARMADARNQIFLIQNQTVRVPKFEGFRLSLLAFSGQCRGVSAENVQYPLSDAVLSSGFPLGVSNEFAGDCAVIRVREGRLMVICSKD